MFNENDSSLLRALYELTVNNSDFIENPMYNEIKESEEVFRRYIFDLMKDNADFSENDFTEIRDAVTGLINVYSYFSFAKGFEAHHSLTQEANTFKTKNFER